MRALVYINLVIAKKQFVPFFNEDDLYPNSPVGPDEIDETHVLWPDTDVLDFHYSHPVTGEEWKGGK